VLLDSINRNVKYLNAGQSSHGGLDSFVIICVQICLF